MVLDGNRRWAAAHGLGPVDGHREGAQRLYEAVEWAEGAGIEVLTLWVLSSDNLRRPATELNGLLPLIADVVDGLAARHRWRIRHLGRTDILPTRLRESLHRARLRTADLPTMTVNMAVGYDGRREIAEAVRQVVNENVPRTEVDSADWEALIGARLDTSGQPDPDLIIRTSGEQRLSGFLLWQCVWSELYFCDAPWPAFTREHFESALTSYATRQRRFGR
jgi:short-chain Z-isoprenyl diphosphate synthase